MQLSPMFNRLSFVTDYTDINWYYTHKLNLMSLSTYIVCIFELESVDLDMYYTLYIVA